MTVLNIVKVGRAGEEILHKIASPILEIEERHHQLAKNMIETMIFFDGVGLAANQIGILERIITIIPSDESGLLNPIIMANPNITYFSEEQDDSQIEGCLSIPGKFGKINRSKRIMIEYSTLNKRKITQFLSNFTARCVQHEIDHLNGILFIDKIKKEENNNALSGRKK